MLDINRRKEILSELLENSDGTRADSYALLQEEFDELADELNKCRAQIESLTAKNNALKAENFRLFERVGAQKDTETPPPPDDDNEETKDYLTEVVDKNGFFR